MEVREEIFEGVLRGELDGPGVALVGLESEGLTEEQIGVHLGHERSAADGLGTGVGGGVADFRIHILK